MERPIVAFAVVVALVGAPNQAAAQPSLAGTWKLNLSKSQLTGQILSDEKAGGPVRVAGHAFVY